MKRSFDEFVANQEVLLDSGKAAIQPEPSAVNIFASGSFVKLEETDEDAGSRTASTTRSQLTEAPFSKLDSLETDVLCTACAKIDLTKAFRPSKDIGVSGKAISERRSGFQPDCSLCNVIRAILSVDFGAILPREQPSSIEYQLRAFDCLRMLRKRRQHRGRKNSPRHDVVVAVVASLVDSPIDVALTNEAITRGVIVPVTHSHAPDPKVCTFRGRKINPASVSFAQVQEWLSECSKGMEDGHQKCWTKTQPKEFNCQVIDCLTRKIVSLTDAMEYFALSYVWGAGQMGTQKTEEIPQLLLDFESTRVPRTIEDAISVVLSLNRRYLWVDRYCIAQSYEKHIQIQNMNLIYEGASLTIVAVNSESTDSADSGLYGISRPRGHQPCVQTVAGTFVTSLPHLSYQLSRSVWATRGWTYQEAVLSRRCLFFTEDQVHFACKRMTRCEAVIKSESQKRDRADHTEVLDASLMRVESQLNFTFTPHLEEPVTKHLREYTNRSLTFQSDIINGFRGILNASHEFSFWGVPYDSHGIPREYSSTSGWKLVRRPHSLEENFVRALMWKSILDPSLGRPAFRRPEFPTWSWASLGAPVSLALEDCWVVKSKSSVVAVSVEDHEGKRIRLDEYYSSSTFGLQRRSIPEMSNKCVYVMCDTALVRLKRSTEKTNGSFWSYYYGKEAHPPNLKLNNKEVLHNYIGEAEIDAENVDVTQAELEATVWTAIWLYAEVNYVTDFGRHSREAWMLIKWDDPVEMTTARRIGMIFVFTRTLNLFAGETTTTREICLR